MFSQCFECGIDQNDAMLFVGKHDRVFALFEYRFGQALIFTGAGALHGNSCKRGRVSEQFGFICCQVARLLTIGSKGPEYGPV